MNKKVVARIKGGLGNQLFCYAAARRLAMVNNAELVLDDVTGFVRDRLYHRKYMLDWFNIPARKAMPIERLEPFERYRRGFKRWFSYLQPFEQRRFLEQEGVAFDERLLSITVKDTLYVDGGWQSERYFKDVEQTIRNDLRIMPPADPLNQRMGEEIRNSHSIALHVRWFDAPGSKQTQNTVVNYYRRAIANIMNRIESPRFFLFSDDPSAAREKLFHLARNVTCVSHNRGDESAYADLWLMTQCRHFIIANSTFSWWGAWLGDGEDKIVVAPGDKIQGAITMWGFDGLLPESWIKLSRTDD